MNLDFACPFTSLTQMLDVKNKRSALTFIDGNGSRTGLIIGKGNEKIEIYDKAIKENFSTSHSRIELRLGKSKLPSRAIGEIPKVVEEGLYFEGLTGLTTKFTDAIGSAEQAHRLAKFKHTFEREGFYSAKKTMNQSRNFDRDFEKLIRIENWPIQPSHLFKTKIKSFLNPGGTTWMQ